MKNTIVLDNVYLIESKQYRKGTPFTIKESKASDSDITLTKSIRVNDKILETGTVIREGIVKVTEKKKSIKESTFQSSDLQKIIKAMIRISKERDVYDQGAESLMRNLGMELTWEIGTQLGQSVKDEFVAGVTDA